MTPATAPVPRGETVPEVGGRGIPHSRTSLSDVAAQIDLPGAGANRELGGRDFIGSAESWTAVRFQRSTRSEFAHNGKVRLQPQHSTEVSPQQHRADHEAFLSLGSALICWQSLRKTWMTRREGAGCSGMLPVTVLLA